LKKINHINKVSMTMAENITQEKKKFSLKGLFQRPSQPYANPYLGGVLLGMVLFASYFITGNGLGASGGISRIAAFLEDLIAPSHIDQVPYLISMAGGPLNPLDNWIVIVTAGVLIGGFVSGVIHGRTKFETNKGPNISNQTRWLFAFLGGIFFTYGARMARGCTSGQALSGGATLSAGSWVVMFSIFGGAYALAYFVRRLWN
jgi:uncharacterized membrane protein YedE/YeeE